MKKNSDYLDNEPPIPLHKPLAHTFGVSAAIILQQIRYWMTTFENAERALPEDKRRHYHQDRWWVYNTYQQWQSDNFGFWSQRTIQRHINTLEGLGVLLSGEFNRNTGDRTKWYTIDFDEMDKLVKKKQETLKASSQVVETITTSCPDHLDKVARSYTETTTESTSETTEDQKITPPTAVAETPSDDTPEREPASQPKIFGAVCWGLGIDPQYVPSKRRGTIGQAATEIFNNAGHQEDVPMFFDWLKKLKDWKREITEHDAANEWGKFKTEQDRKNIVVYYNCDTPEDIAYREKAAKGWAGQTPEDLARIDAFIAQIEESHERSS